MSYRNWIRPIFFITYIVVLCIVIPLCVIELRSKNAPSNVQAWFIGGIFVLAALPISLWTILNHLINFTSPHLQRHIIRVLWMVPIYALDAWFGLRFAEASIYFNTARECYEAYVIYNFMAFLLNFLRHEYPDIEFMVEQKNQVKHFVPCCCIRPWPMGRYFIDRCRHGVLQYTVIRPITTAISFVCELYGVYGEGEFRLDKAYPYIAFINNASQIWAMYCLILFYRCTRVELRPMKPVAKFLCVKFVVFMSFWQSILIAILIATGVIQNVEAWKLYSTKDISLGLQNFSICVEMFVAAVAHHFSFPYHPYVDRNSSYNDCFWSFWTMWDVSDVKNDVVDHVRHVGHSVRTAVMRNNKDQIRSNTENTPLMMVSPSDGEYDSTDSTHHNHTTPTTTTTNGGFQSPKNHRHHQRRFSSTDYGDRSDFVIGGDGAGGQSSSYQQMPSSSNDNSTLYSAFMNVLPTTSEGMIIDENENQQVSPTHVVTLTRTSNNNDPFADVDIDDNDCVAVAASHFNDIAKV